MSKVDFIWLLIAGLVGSIGAYDRNQQGALVHGRSIAWAIVALFGFLGALGIIV